MGQSVRLALCAAALLWTNIASAGVGAPLVTPTPVPLNFGTQVLGTTSAPSTETYTVSGGTPGIGVEINAISTTGDFAVAPGGTCQTGFLNALFSPSSCTVRVTFTPTSPGTRNGTLIFNCNAVLPVGGGAFTCGPLAADHAVALIGNALAVGAVPALSSFALALLSSVLILATFLSLKRRRS
jgi:hypothetical protein